MPSNNVNITATFHFRVKKNHSSYLHTMGKAIPTQCGMMSYGKYRPISKRRYQSKIKSFATSFTQSKTKDRLNHILDTVAISKFIRNVIDEDGVKILQDALKICKIGGGKVPFMEALVESEFTMFQYEIGVRYTSKCRGILNILIFYIIIL